jgi:chromosomal replication initiation ATPase DnaA
MSTAVQSINRSDPHELWEYVLSQVELSVTSANFNTWFQKSCITRIEDGIVYIGLPSLFYKDWYIKKFNNLLLKILRSILSSLARLTSLRSPLRRRRSSVLASPTTRSLCMAIPAVGKRTLFRR